MGIWCQFLPCLHITRSLPFVLATTLSVLRLQCGLAISIAGHNSSRQKARANSSPLGLLEANEVEMLASTGLAGLLLKPPSECLPQQDLTDAVSPNVSVLRNFSVAKDASPSTATAAAGEALLQVSGTEAAAGEVAADKKDLRKGLRHRKPIFWVHLHNFAGTYICQEAHKQGEKTPPEPTGWPGCLMPNEGCSQLPGLNRSHCNKRLVKGYTFSMAERDVDDRDLNCESMMTGTMLRDPVVAAQSTLRSNHFNKTELMQVLRSGVVSELTHTECLPWWDSYHHFDNFATRTLGGGYSVGLRQVTEAHLEKAKKRLRNMDVVVILEDLEAHMPQFEHVFGWEVSQMTPHHKLNAHCDPAQESFSEEETAYLKQLNSFDYLLYEFAKELAANRTSAALQLMWK
mmetsp:Transcript_49004/g.116573  ORF Transcript_49004/g.116573 Transcript_49004/m.116573 type:complete len:402 (-) Transcript_49004:63-1268(-)